MKINFIYSTVKSFASGLALSAVVMLFATGAYGQPETAVYPDDVLKQRLLIRITANYLYTVSQGQVDVDSAVRISCRAYGLSPLLIYNEGYSDGKPSSGTQLLDAGRVKEARIRLTRVHDESRLRLLLEMGAYFIFKPGEAKADLDEASTYIKEAVALSKGRSVSWKIESLMLRAFLLHQSGQRDESQAVFTEIMTLCEQTKNRKGLAQALLSSGRSLPYGHPSRLANFEKALSIFETLNAKEKEIEAYSELSIEHFVFKRYGEVEKYLHKTLARLIEINHRHLQYTYDALSFINLQKGNLPEAISYSNKSHENLRTKADSVFAPFFYTRRAGLSENLDRPDEALYNYNKAMQNRSNDTRLYWYKAFLGKTRFLNSLDRHDEALVLLEEMENDFPPRTIFEKMHFAYLLGETYEKLKQWKLAEKNYAMFLSIAQDFPMEYVHAEFFGGYFAIADFYRVIGKTKKAREILSRTGPESLKTGTTSRGLYFACLFKIDSTEQRYVEAIHDLQLSRQHLDSAFGYEQKKKVDELLVKYEAEKKDKDILLLKQQSELQHTRLQQARFTQRMTILGAGLLLLVAALLYYLYRTKQRSNTQLKRLVTEKEWLLKEVHHRVKNNLQTVLSLLESQSRKLSNEALHAMQESQNRVYAMSLIHKKLYQSTDVASIDMEDYLRDLIQHLRESFGSSGTIRFSLQLEPINLDVSQAVPIGLIVNEAITNAIKYAFPEKGPDNEIVVSLTSAHDKTELTISDNGIGMTRPEKDTTQSLGLKLMRGLTEDIDGFFTIDTDRGVNIHIQFVPNVPLQRLNVAALPAHEIESA